MYAISKVLNTHNYIYSFFSIEENFLSTHNPNHIFSY